MEGHRGSAGTAARPPDGPPICRTGRLGGLSRSSGRSGTKYTFIRVVLRVVVGALLRVRVRGREHIPTGPYLMCFSHPSWIDPFLIVGFWPGPERLFILGPRELDMRIGWRNRLITWAERGVPFQPGGQDTREVARRASAVLRGGNVLAISGEGRLSDREGEVVPFVEGAAFFALREQVPVVPVGIVGTRWVHWGKTVGFVIGRPIAPPPIRASRVALRTFTATIQASVEELIRGRDDGPDPTRFWRWFSELFNERSWLDEPPTADPGKRSAEEA